MAYALKNKPLKEKKNFIVDNSKNWSKGTSGSDYILYTKKGTYGNSKQEITISQEIMSKKWEVDFFNIKGKKYEQFNTKKEAENYAKKYMKEN